MSREDDLVGAIIDCVQEKIVDVDSKGRPPSRWLTTLAEMCDELDALRERREVAAVMELLRR